MIILSIAPMVTIPILLHFNLKELNKKSTEQHTMITLNQYIVAIYSREIIDLFQ